MMPVARRALTPATQQVLATRAKGAMGLAPGSDKIEGRWKYFLRTDATIRPANRSAVTEVRSTLDAMFQGKCCYCEKIIANDVEHHYPKTLYPQPMFDWTNLLPACKDCNHGKLDADPENPTDPGGGRSILDPTLDRPEEYLCWDLLTGSPVIVNPNGPSHRGERTVALCDLRNQKFCEQRRKQASRFKSLLLRAATTRPVDAETVGLLDDLVHPGEQWLGVIRQILRDPAMSPLVQSVEIAIPHLAPRFAALRWTHP
jgi:uncharacterized protein (TIGR02646 family)